MDYAAGRNRYMGYLISLGLYSFKGMKVGLEKCVKIMLNYLKDIIDYYERAFIQRGDSLDKFVYIDFRKRM